MWLATSGQGGNIESSRTRYDRCLGLDEAHVRGAVIEEQTTPFFHVTRRAAPQVRPDPEMQTLGPERAGNLRFTLGM